MGRKTAALYIVVLVIVAASLITILLRGDNKFTEQSMVTYIDITVEQAHLMIINNEVSLVIDVRTLEEYTQGYISGAVNIPLDELEARISELENYKDKPIIVYCRSGVRSRLASEILVQENFKRVYNMLGGINSWIQAGYPVEKPLPTV